MKGDSEDLLRKGAGCEAAWQVRLVGQPNGARADMEKSLSSEFTADDPLSVLREEAGG